MLRNAEVQEYIKERNEQLDVQFIADITETKRFWTEIMRDTAADMKDRLKASEYIAKTNGAFVEKKELKGAFDGKITFGLMDPAIDENLQESSLLVFQLARHYCRAIYLQ